MKGVHAVLSRILAADPNTLPFADSPVYAQNQMARFRSLLQIVELNAFFDQQHALIDREHAISFHA